MRKQAVVTGASRGIGRAIARELAVDCDLILTARTLGGLSETAAECRALGADVQIFEADITSGAEAEQLAKRIAASTAAIDLLVNNAGIAPSMKLEQTTLAELENIFALNFTAPFVLVREFLPALIRSKGMVINIASTAALEGYPYTAAYTASKHALLGLTRAAAAELERKGVRFYAVCPGFVRTDIVKKGAEDIMARSQVNRGEAEQRLGAMNAGGKLLEPEEVAAIVRKILQSPQANGSAIRVE